MWSYRPAPTRFWARCAAGIVLLIATATAMAGERLRVVADLYPDHDATYTLAPPVAIADRYYALTRNPGTGKTDLWRSDGTAEGTTVIATFLNRVSPRLWVTADRLYAIAWRVDGERLVQDVWTCTNSDTELALVVTVQATTWREITQVTTCRGRLLLRAKLLDSDWHTPRLVALSANSVTVIDPPLEPIGPVMATADAVFCATNDLQAATLWRIDGDTLAASPVRTLAKSPESFSHLSVLATTSARVFFRTTHLDITGDWSSDGSEADTQALGTIIATPDTTTLGQHLVFVGADHEPWISDGSTTGTQRIDDLIPGPEGSGPSPLVTADDQVFFYATTDDSPEYHQISLMRSDGTTGGTRAVHAMNPAAYSPEAGGIPYGPWEDVAVLGSTVYFAEYDDHCGLELWSSDGTSAGTRRLTDGNPRQAHFNPRGITAVAGRVFVLGDDGRAGTRLWVYDPTPTPQTSSTAAASPRVSTSSSGGGCGAGSGLAAVLLAMLVCGLRRRD